MATLDERANLEAAGPDIDTGAGAGPGIANEPETGNVLGGLAGFFGKLLTAETGAGAVAAYVEHPLNIGRSEAVAQVLRGLTGFAAVFGLDSLRLAVVDVIAGLLRLRKPAGPVA